MKITTYFTHRFMSSSENIQRYMVILNFLCPKLPEKKTNFIYIYHKLKLIFLGFSQTITHMTGKLKLLQNV